MTRAPSPSEPTVTHLMACSPINKHVNGSGYVAGIRARHHRLCKAVVLQGAQTARPDISQPDPVLQRQWDRAANRHLGMSSQCLTAIESGDSVTNVQMATCTGGLLLCTAVKAQAAPSAQGKECASTNPWPPGLPWLQQNGIQPTMTSVQKSSQP